MRVTAKIDYACRALLELSLNWPNKDPIQLSTIADHQDIPIRFLTQILLNLKQLGYVESIRGQKGGYLLATSPLNIRLSDLIQNFGNTGFSIAENQSGRSNVMGQVWEELDRVLIEAMDQLTFDILVNRYKNHSKKVMFHI